jgi:hypothetical protein
MPVTFIDYINLLQIFINLILQYLLLTDHTIIPKHNSYFLHVSYNDLGQL